MRLDEAMVEVASHVWGWGVRPDLLWIGFSSWLSSRSCGKSPTTEAQMSNDSKKQASTAEEVDDEPDEW
jgi:hypothetical protein